MKTMIVLGGLVLGTAFIYKVWNERQMTLEYRRLSDAVERIAQQIKP